MTRMRENKILERIKLAEKNVDFAVTHAHRNPGMGHLYWMGYLNALRLVVKMPPDDEVAPEEDYEL